MLPNLLTFARLALSLAMFASLIALAAAEHGAPIPDAVGVALIWFSLAAFIVAGITDFLDGWLARRFNVTSLTGAILDPIADKVLVCGAIVGLIAVGMPYAFSAMGGLILMREFAVSAMREVLAPRGIKLPVTLLAKTKTALQIVALAACMALAFWPAWGMHVEVGVLRTAWTWCEVLLAVATAVTLSTGAQYARSAMAALKA
ncbi:MAG TPA: CDP-diacylglycerol--glycerol-3-phosphate 3-phosphatidyltransferase [Caulobacteraceae bacterium]|nr:CDP-diacylglycerol--glycerol-3-phosphate 3-phosphatidyltransferase [Caulobacteraceae bacterium]